MPFLAQPSLWALDIGLLRNCWAFPSGITGGLAHALTGAIGVAVIAEFLDSSFKTPHDVESTLDLPVLVSIPRLSRRHLMLN